MSNTPSPVLLFVPIFILISTCSTVCLFLLIPSPPSPGPSITFIWYVDSEMWCHLTGLQGALEEKFLNLCFSPKTCWIWQECFISATVTFRFYHFRKVLLLLQMAFRTFFYCFVLVAENMRPSFCRIGYQKEKLNFYTCDLTRVVSNKYYYS